MSITNSKLGVTINNDVATSNCCCSTSVTNNFGDLELTLHRENCEDTTSNWYRFEFPNWVVIPGEENQSLITPAESGFYRVHTVNTEGCCDLYTAPVYFYVPIV